MRSKAMQGAKTGDIKRIHGQVVETILSQHKPDKHVSSAWAQWLIWLAVSVSVIAMIVLTMGMKDNGGQLFRSLSAFGFLLAAFVGAALAAWEAIASSIPSRRTGPAYRLFSALVLTSLVVMPFLFFYPWGQPFDVVGEMKAGMDCIMRVSMLGVVPWMVLGWLLSRNAAFHPGWTGAWSGASAFLIGTIAVQLHCSIWDARHILIAHLLPVAICVFVTTFIGAYWFSRWEK